MGVSGQRHASAALYPRYSLDRRLGGAPEPVWTQRLEEKSSAPVGDRTPVVQSVVRHYTDWATPVPSETWSLNFSISWARHELFRFGSVFFCYRLPSVF
jgi:hypothetical protein